MAGVTEIAPDVYRISVYAARAGLQFNHFLVNDDEPLLFHTGLRGMFPDVREAVSRIIEPSRLRVIGFSHFESDECGALSVNDFIGRPARGLTDGGTLSTGKYRFRFCRTPHLPHGWEAGVLFEETQHTLFCSDLFHQNGDVEPLTESDVVGRSQQSIAIMHGSSFGGDGARALPDLNAAYREVFGRHD